MTRVDPAAAVIVSSSMSAVWIVERDPSQSSMQEQERSGERAVRWHAKNNARTSIIPAGFEPTNKEVPFRALL
jgi:hypothetical protein